MTKKCKHCNTDFETLSRAKTYCSSKCVQAKYMERTGKAVQSKRQKLNKPNRSPEKQKDRKLQERYGLTLVQYNEMCLKQEQKCKICGIEQKLHVDHDHLTGKIRGLLCNGCNRGLGFFSDNMAALEKAAQYLKDQGCS